MHAENQKNEAAARLRRYAMLNWWVHVEKAERYFNELALEGKTTKFFEALYVSRNDSDRQIQLFSGQHPISDLLVKKDSHGREIGREFTFEHGAALVLSQAINGTVAIILYPYESEAASRTSKYIIWKILDNPTEITDSLLRKGTNDFLCYMRVSSVLFTESVSDRLRIAYLEWRGRRYIGSGGLVKLLFSNWFLPALGAVGSVASIWSILPRK
jgi:hypothetical protein